MDVCCLNRPFDDLSHDKIRFEAEAVISILKRCEADDNWTLVGGDIVILEISKTTDPAKKQDVRIRVANLLNYYMEVMKNEQFDG